MRDFAAVGWIIGKLLEAASDLRRQPATPVAAAARKVRRVSDGIGAVEASTMVHGGSLRRRQQA
jgi:hypothetical protein